MTLIILSFAAGVLFMQLQPELPGTGWLGLSAFFLSYFFRQKILYLPGAFAIGFSWALGMAHLRLADRLAPELEGGDIEVVGVVSSLPAAGGAQPALRVRAGIGGGETAGQDPPVVVLQPVL